MTLKDASELTELGLFFYHHLLAAPPFRYAQVGVEAEQFRDFSELTERVYTLPNGMRFVHQPGFVVCEDIWQAMGEPTDMSPFSQGYYWSYYQGELFDPSYGRDSTGTKLRELKATLPRLDRASVSLRKILAYRSEHGANLREAKAAIDAESLRDER